jgi:hypothetical protein
MRAQHKTVTGVLLWAVVTAVSLQGQGAETFTATASVKSAGGAAATSPVRIVVTRKMPKDEADKFLNAFKSGGVTALRNALSGVKPTGTIQLGKGKPTPTRLTVERTTDKGRLLTIVTDRPVLFVGSSIPGSKAKQGYDFAVVDLEVDSTGKGTGSLAPAAKVTVKGDAFVVEDYAVDRVELKDVTKAAKK